MNGGQEDGGLEVEQAEVFGMKFSDLSPFNISDFEKGLSYAEDTIDRLAEIREQNIGDLR